MQIQRITAGQFVNYTLSAIVNVLIGSVILWLALTYVASLFFAAGTLPALSFVQCLVLVVIARVVLSTFVTFSGSYSS